jgi:acyl-CoA synthetase (NDP forming)
MYGIRRSLDLKAFIRPASVAIIGGSRNPASLTARPRRYLADLGFTGQVTVVNPAGSAHDRYGSVRSISDLPPGIDVALIVLSADTVAESLAECVKAGIQNAVVLASNVPAANVLAVLAKYPELRLLGPNCLGVVAPCSSTYLTFSGALSLVSPYRGPVALLTQSGAVGNGLLLSLMRRGVGVDCWLSTGDERDIGTLEAVAAVGREVQPKAIGVFIEGVTDVQFLSDVESVIRDMHVPVLAVRAGLSELGQAAALGHTGKVVKNASITQQLLQEIGVMVVGTLNELCDSLCLLSLFDRPVQGPEVSVAVLAPSGGMGVLAADAIASTERVRLASFSEEREEIREVLAASTNDGRISNPLDVPGATDPDAFERCARALRSSQHVDAVVCVVSELVNSLENVSLHPPGGSVPMALSCLSPDEPFSWAQRRQLAAAGIPVIDDIGSAIRSIGRWAQIFGASQTGLSGPDSHEHGGRRPEQHGIIGTERVIGQALARWLVPTAVISTESEALAQAEHMGYPVVIKSEGSSIEHRALVGAVRVGLLSPTDISAAFREVAGVAGELGDDVVMQPQVDAGVEAMISAIRDPEVGPIVLCKRGGSRAEDDEPVVLLGGWDMDWHTRLTSSGFGKELTSSSAGLTGVLALATAMYRLVERRADIVEIECNPVIVPVDGRTPQIVDILTFAEPSVREEQC